MFIFQLIHFSNLIRYVFRFSTVLISHSVTHKSNKHRFDFRHMRLIFLNVVKSLKPRRNVSSGQLSKTTIGRNPLNTKTIQKKYSISINRYSNFLVRCFCKNYLYRLRSLFFSPWYRRYWKGLAFRYSRVGRSAPSLSRKCKRSTRSRKFWPQVYLDATRFFSASFSPWIDRAEVACSRCSKFSSQWNRAVSVYSRVS